MAVPWTWRSLPEVAAEIPELRGRLRGGLADLVKRLIDQARRKALGEDERGRIRGTVNVPRAMLPPRPALPAGADGPPRRLG